jgi:fatty acid-binding protein DegV
MPSSCIITDSAAQFSRINFPESYPLRFIEFKTEYSLPFQKEKNITGPRDFPRFLPLGHQSIITPPSANEVSDLIVNAINKFDDVFIILHSKEINPAFELVTNTLAKTRGRANVHLINSQTLSIGQGFLIQSTIDMLSRGVSALEIEERLRERVPHIYTLICAPNLSYLNIAGHIDEGQSIVSEMQSLLPIFGLEEGRLNALDKMKNAHAVVDYFIEYIEEFDNLEQVAFLQSSPPMVQEAKAIKLYLEENYPDTLYTEHPHNNFVASLMGPRGFGLVVIERFP